MLFYLIIFIISTCLVEFGSNCKKSQRPLIAGIGFLIPALVAAFRSVDVGTDTTTYIELYNSIVYDEEMSVILMILDTDLFFYCSCFIAQYIGGIQIIFFVYSFLTLLFLYKALAKYKRHLPVWLGYILFLFFFYNSSLNIMRQILAISFILWATSFLFDGKKKKFIILSVISIIFHMSAIAAGGLIYIIYTISQTSRRKKPLAFLLFYMGVIFAFLCVNIMVTHMAVLGVGHSYAYTASAGQSQIGATDILISMLLILISYVAMKRKLVSDVSNDFFYLSCIVCLMLFMTGIYNRFLMRMAYYNLTFACLYLPLIVNAPKLRQKRSVYTLGVLLLGFSYWLYLFVISGSNATLPYSTEGGLMFDF